MFKLNHGWVVTILTLSSFNAKAADALPLNIPGYVPPSIAMPVEVIPPPPVAIQSVSKLFVKPSAPEKPKEKKITCDEVAEKIYEADQGHLSFLQPWADVKWLKSQIGTPTIEPFDYQVYSWGIYLIKVSSAGSIEMGPRPIDLATVVGVPNIGMATHILGPADQVIEEKGATYSWQCQNHSNISIAESEKGLKTFSGQYCVQDNCYSFTTVVSLDSAK